MAEEFYTRSMFRVADVAKSIDYYCEKLGFETAWTSGDDPIVIAQVGRNGLDIILDLKSVIPRAAIPSVLSLSLHQSGGLWALHNELRDRGAKIKAAPFEVVWQAGTFQMDVEDIDGNILLFWGEAADD